MYAILPAAFPALQSCTWSLDRALLPSERKAFPAEAVTAITHVRAQQVVRAAPLQFTLEWTASSEPEAVATLRTALGEADIPIGVGQGGVVVEFAKPDLEFNYGPPDPPALILTPKLCLTDDSKVADLGEDISASLERIRDLKDQAVVVGDRVQISRIAQALQEGEWLCVERSVRPSTDCPARLQSFPPTSSPSAAACSPGKDFCEVCQNRSLLCVPLSK